jgi:3-oxoacyl-[acyl-carrier-protein] synthase II
MINDKAIAITGIGLVTPLGIGRTIVWDRLVDGQCGIGAIESFHTLPDFDVQRLDARVAGFVPNGQDAIDAVISKKDQKKMGRFVAWALLAADEALADAGWRPSSESAKERTGVCIGSGVGGLPEIETTSLSLNRGEKTNPFFVPSCLINLAGGNVAIKHGLKGPNVAPVTACASGAHAIGEAAKTILSGQADVMVAGGCEAAICPLVVSGFQAMKALSTKYNDTPHLASRPWDKNRDGFVIGEGAGIVILEELNHALDRNAPIYGLLSGYGLSCDAYHIASPDELGHGAKRCMDMALRDAQLMPSDIGYINGHSTSTPVGDKAELRAIESLFSAGMPVSSTKGATGHLLGAAGSIEAIFALLAVKNGVLPPTLNMHDAEETCLDLIAYSARSVPDIQHVLSNSFGFGGTNASLIFSRYNG